MRPRSRLPLLAVLTTVAATALPVLTAPTPASAVTCKPPTTLLVRTKPVTSSLPGGATMRVWDTGPTPSNPLASQRIVAIRIPHGSRITPAVVTAGALTARATVGTYAGRVATSVAAINGAVFDPVTAGAPQRAMLLHGRALKASTRWDPMLTRSQDGTLGLDNMRISGTVSAAGQTWAATGLNWNTVTGSGVNAWTRDWGTAPRPYGLVDVVVYGGKVVAVRTGTARGQAPASGQTILTANGTVGQQLASLRVGRAVTLGYRMQTLSGASWYDAISRGNRYLFQGTTDGGTCGTRDELLRPRSAIGWMPNGDMLLIAVQGRALINGVHFGGATVHQMPTYLTQLGAVMAVGLDGGGSTTLMARPRLSLAPVRVDRTENVGQRAVPDSLVWYLH